MAVWTNAVGGNWSDLTKWTGAVPNAVGDTAAFTTLTGVAGNSIIDLASMPAATATLGTLAMTSSSLDSYTLQNGTIVLQAVAGNAAINVTTSGGGTLLNSAILANLQLNSNTVVTTTGANTTLNVQGLVSGTGQLIKADSGTLRLGNSANNWTGGLSITGGKLLTTGANVLGANSLAMSVASTLDIGGFDQTIGNLSGGAGFITNSVGGVKTLTVNNTANSTYAGLVTASLALTKIGAGVLTLSGGNSYTGATTVNAGTLKGGAANTFSNASSVTVALGATLDLGGFNQTLAGLNGAGSVTSSAAGAINLSTGAGAFSGVLSDGSGTLGLTKVNAGTLFLSGANTYSGVTTISAGAIRTSAANALSANSSVSIAAGATLDLGGFNQSIGALSGAGIVRTTGGTAVLTETNAAATFANFSGTIVNGTGLVGLTKNGAGTLTLSGVNTYTGATTINAGVLKAGVALTLSINTSLFVAAGATFDLGGFNQQGRDLSGAGAITTSSLSALQNFQETNNNDVTFSGIISDGAGRLSLTKLGLGTLTLSGVNTYSGLTFLVNGALSGAAANTFSANSAMDISATGTLDLGGFNQSIGALSGAGAITSSNIGSVVLTQANAGASTYSGAISDGDGNVGFTKNGAGVLTLSGANTYSGVTTINAGVLKAGAANALSANSSLNLIAGASLDLGGFNQSIRVLTGTGAVTNSLAGAAILTQNNLGNATFSGVIQNGVGAVGLTKAGAGRLTLSGANTYSGTTTVSGGTLRAGAANAFSANSAHNVGGGATLELGGFNQTIAALSGSGTVKNSVNGAVTLTINTASDTIFSGTITEGAASSVTSLTKTGAGALTLAGSNFYNGVTTINGGSLKGTAANQMPSTIMIVNAGGTLDLGGFNQSVRALSGAGSVTSTLAGAVTLSLSVDSTFSGTISDGAGLISLVTNSSFQTLSGVNTYSGATTITAGALALAGTGSIANSSSVSGTGFFDISGVSGSSATVKSLGNLVNGINFGGKALNVSAQSGNFVASLNGSAGVDALIINLASASADFSATSVFASFWTEGTDSIVINGNALANVLTGSIQSDLIFGGAGADTLNGGDGNDTLSGGTVGAGFTNLLNGDNGSDTVSYAGVSASVFVDLNSGGGHIGGVFTDTLTSIENVIGGSNDDTLLGTDALANRLEGGAGTDVLFGFDGADTLLGGSANASQYNQLFGGLGLDTAAYTGVTNSVYADLNVFAGFVDNGGFVLTDVYNSIENLVGGSAADSLVGDAGANIITGAGGADILYGNTGVGFDASIDRFIYNSAADSNFAGYDTIANFVTGQDKLDFSALGINASFVSIQSGGGSTSVYANTDGVAGFDLALVVIGNNAVAMVDIIF